MKLSLTSCKVVPSFQILPHCLCCLLEKERGNEGVKMKYMLLYSAQYNTCSCVQPVDPQSLVDRLIISCLFCFAMRYPELTLSNLLQLTQVRYFDLHYSVDLRLQCVLFVLFGIKMTFKKQYWETFFKLVILK